ncbi:ABC transporter permease [Psychroflexus sediminis]|uniref:ABC-type transport system involved in multi-copper enzyme maturation, permease component n=1 Tax=Psychroflexus sediminis TaxID=470826 RepID=A0A1G7ZC90_9FLAO|nr:ABC transporter permease [Psychroflexus sediminis]SDH06197.1 ABC-type transport system involved in multi-copper enzyme maturation, permease component [Psychroflexus sediminis]
MKRLFLIEFHKLKNNKAAKILSLIYFILFSAIALFASIKFNFGSIDFRLADQGIFNFPFIWHFNAYFVAFLKLFLAVVIVSMVSSEYTNRTLKQNLIDGLSKKEFILSKFYGVLGFALASTLLLFIVSLILGLIFSDYDEFNIVFSDLEYIFAYFLKLVGFFSLCLFFGILLKRSAFALGFLFLLWIFEGIVQLFVKFQAESLDFILNFLPLQSMSNLIIEPFTRLGIVKSAATQLNSEFTKSYDVEWSAILIVMGWSFIFVYSSWKLLQKRDL